MFTFSPGLGRLKDFFQDSDNIEDDRPEHGDQNSVRHREPTQPPAD